MSGRGQMRRRMGTASIGMAALVLMVSAGCGDSGDKRPAEGGGAPPAAATASPATEIEESAAPAAKTLPDPCTLVTKAEAEKLAATRLEDAVAVRETCTYTGAAGGPTAQVEVYVGDGAKKMLDIDRDLAHAFTPLAGIGDEAHLEDGVVFVRKGETWVAIRLVRLDDPATFRKPLEDAARSAAGRM